MLIIYYLLCFVAFCIVWNFREREKNNNTVAAYAAYKKTTNTCLIDLRTFSSLVFDRVKIFYEYYTHISNYN